MLATQATGPVPTPRLRRRRSLVSQSRPVSGIFQAPPSRPVSMVIPAHTLPPLDTTDDHDPRLPPRPYPNSYWATPSLLGSEYPSKGREEQTLARLEALIDVGITDFIDLTEPGERLPGEQYLRPLAAVATRRGLGLLKMAGTDNIDRSRLACYPGVIQDPRFQHVAAASDWQRPQAGNVLRYASFPITDTTLPDPLTIQSILSALSYSTKQGRRVVVHCNGGYGRTGTVIGAWLVFAGYVRDTFELVPNTYTYARTPQGGQQLVPYSRQKKAGDYALELLAKKWKGVEKSRVAPFTPGNSAQFEFVRNFRPPVRAPARTGA